MVYFAPECILLFSFLFFAFFSLFYKQEDSGLSIWIAVGFFLCALFMEAHLWKILTERELSQKPLVMEGIYVLDSFSVFMKILFLSSSLFTLLLSYFTLSHVKSWFSLFLSATTLGACLLVSAVDLWIAFLSMIFFLIGSCLLLGYSKNASAREGAFKHFIYGTVLSGLMICGIVLMYGLCGSTRMEDIYQYLSSLSNPPQILFLAILLLFAGIGFLCSFFPFHFSQIDGAEGTETAFAVYVLWTSKGAGFVLLFRMVDFLIPVQSYRIFQTEGILFSWSDLLAVFAAVTLTYGNLAALWQQNMKRLLAYSSVAQSGYLLMVLCLFAEGNPLGLSIFAFVFLMLLFSNLSIFGAVAIAKKIFNVEEIREYRGLACESPLLAFLFFIPLLSLVGLPITGGFIAKVLLFQGFLHQKLYWLLVIVLLNLGLASYYYFRIIKALYLDLPTQSPEKIKGKFWGEILLLIIPMAGILWGGFLPNSCMKSVEKMKLFSFPTLSVEKKLSEINWTPPTKKN